MSESKGCESRTPPSESISTGDMPEQSGKEIQVDYQPTPSRKPPEHKIHPRQKIPPVPEGEDVADKDPSPPVEID